jgi:hypothetical protein
MRLALVIAAGLALGGCGAIVPTMKSGGGLVVGWLSTPANDLALLNAAMEADAPLKEAWCGAHRTLPPAIAAYCAHVPRSVDDLPRVINDMLGAGLR